MSLGKGEPCSNLLESHTRAVCLESLNFSPQPFNVAFLSSSTLEECHLNSFCKLLYKILKKCCWGT